MVGGGATRRDLPRLGPRRGDGHRAAARVLGSAKESTVTRKVTKRAQTWRSALSVVLRVSSQTSTKLRQVRRKHAGNQGLARAGAHVRRGAARVLPRLRCSLAPRGRPAGARRSRSRRAAGAWAGRRVGRARAGRAPAAALSLPRVWSRGCRWSARSRASTLLWRGSDSTQLREVRPGREQSCRPRRDQPGAVRGHLGRALSTRGPSRESLEHAVES
jgi:hypothetical protein